MNGFNKMGILAALILGLILVILNWYQERQIKCGKLIVLYQTNGYFEGGPIFISKNNRQIIIKKSVFPIVLFEGDGGQVRSQRNMIAPYRVYLTVHIPANDEEKTLFRQYFPIQI